MTASVPIRDAATIILVREADTNPSILMGQRGRGAVFMPDKFVFPGGAVDASDKAVQLGEPLPKKTEERLHLHPTASPPNALAVAAIRELWEETGLRLATRGHSKGLPDGWQGFDARPSGAHLHMFFRAITPEGRPRRFDARFFLASAEALLGSPDDHPASTEELKHLSWVPLAEVRKLNLAFVTELVLAELSKHLPRLDAPDRVPFIRNDSLDQKVIWL